MHLRSISAPSEASWRGLNVPAGDRNMIAQSIL
jgi:hypothetical protein